MVLPAAYGLARPVGNLADVRCPAHRGPSPEQQAAAQHYFINTVAESLKKCKTIPMSSRVG
jgi:hypothetical protein